jgi:uncharacterized alpha-E superfamily protein
MGTLSITKTDHLLWLGRYMERTLTTLRFVLFAYDSALDSDNYESWIQTLRELGFKEEITDLRKFFQDCLFSPTLPSSIRHSLDCAYDNAVTLRDSIGSESIAYVQMAVDNVEKASTSTSPLLDLQLIIDNIMAFKGTIEDSVTDDTARYLVKCGMSLERLDLYTRLGFQLELLPQVVHRLGGRIARVGVPYDAEKFRRMVDIIYAPEFPANMTPELSAELLTCIDGIF